MVGHHRAVLVLLAIVYGVPVHVYDKIDKIYKFLNKFYHVLQLSRLRLQPIKIAVSKTLDTRNTTISIKCKSYTECGYSPLLINQRIRNGKDISQSKFPWMVAIVNKTASVECSGSIITNRHILTAAHCVN